MKSFITRNKILCIILAVTMTIGMVSTVLAQVGTDAVATGLCEHHSEHENCGYESEFVWSDCTHNCSEGDCCYVKGSDCEHEHDADCGAHCDHVCGDDCLGEDGNCTHEHDDYCTYSSEGCLHLGYFDEDGMYTLYENHNLCSEQDCGYSAGYACGHECSEPECGELVERVISACEYICEYCADGGDGEEELEDTENPGTGSGYSEAAYAKIIVNDEHYTGESIYFTLVSRYNSPENDTEFPETVTFRINIEESVSGTFTFIPPDINSYYYVSDESSLYYGCHYFEIPKGSINDPGGIIYMYYNEEAGWFEYTTVPGRTISYTLEYKTDNGTTDSGITLTLTPELKDSDDFPSDDVVLEYGSTMVKASFGWYDVDKTITEGEVFGRVGDWMSDIKYNISAFKWSTAEEGVIYTNKYVLTDTITLNGFYINDVSGEGKTGPEERTTKSINGVEVPATETHYLINGITAIYVDKLGATIKPLYKDNDSTTGLICGFEITYTVDRNQALDEDLENLNINAYLELYYLYYLTCDNNSETYLTFDATATGNYSANNEAVFKAYSYFYDGEETLEEGVTNGITYHKSEDGVIATATGIDTLTKNVYASSDEATTNNGMTETVLKTDYKDKVYFTITYTNNNQLHDKLYISDILVTTVNGKSLYNLASLNVESIEVTGKNENTKWDEALKWDGISTELTINTYQYVYLDGYDGEKAISMYKEFTNVPLGATITIIYSIEMITSNATDNDDNPIAAAPGSIGINASYATKEINDTSCTYKGTLLASDSTRLYIDQTDTTIKISKTYTNTATTPVKDATLKNADGIVFYVEITNTSDVAIAYIKRVVENWPFENIKLTGITAADGNGNTTWAGYNLNVYKCDANGDITPANSTPIKTYTTWPTFDSAALALWAAYSPTSTTTGTITTTTPAINPADYFTIEKADGSLISIAPGETIKLTLKGTVVSVDGLTQIGTSDLSGCNNEVWVELPGGSGSGSGSNPKADVTVKIIPLDVTPLKRAYRIQVDATDSTKWAWDQSGADIATSGYQAGEIVRYELSATNKTETTINNIYVADSLPTYFGGNAYAEFMKEGTYTSWTNKEATGYVIAEYPNGDLEVLENRSGLASTHTDYITNSKSRKGFKTTLETSSGVQYTRVGMVVNKLSLKPGETVKFHIFFKITAETYDAYMENNTNGILNSINIYAWNDEDLSTPTDLLTRYTSNTIYLASSNDLRTAKVTKTPYAVIKGLNTTSGTLKSFDAYYDSIKLASTTDTTGDLVAEEGDYVVYLLNFTNTSPTSLSSTDAQIKVYSISDTLPDYLEFVGFASPGVSNSTAYFNTSSKYVRVYKEGFYGTIYSGTKTTLGQSEYNNLDFYRLNVSYDKEANTATIYRTVADGPHALSRNNSLAVLIIAKVKTDQPVYDNEGGFEIPRSVDVGAGNNNKEYSSANTSQLATSTASISGPSYEVGIDKKATQVKIGGNWLNIGSSGSSNIQPNTPVKWEVTLTNSINSSGDVKDYVITDILPKEFTLYSTEGYSFELQDSNGNKLFDSSDTSYLDYWNVVDNVLTITISASDTTCKIPVGGSLKLIIYTTWKTGVGTVLGSYENEARLTLTNRVIGKYTYGEGWTDNDRKTIFSRAKINMMGLYVTSSYKKIENITEGPCYENKTTAYTVSEAIDAVAGDTVEYTLTVSNDSSIAISKMVLIDVLPHMNDTGVLNTSAKRYSEFGLTFADTPNVTVTVGEDTLTLGNDYTVTYANKTDSEGKTVLSEYDWAGNGSGWSTPSSGYSNFDTIRVVITKSIPATTTVTVTFNAVVPENTAPGLIAWNSFAYEYTPSGTETVLHSEPIRVGVRVPGSIITVTKAVVDADGNTIVVSDDSPVFTFQLLKLSGADWNAVSITGTDAEGKFTLKNGDSITLSVPDDSGSYKVVELPTQNNYSLYSVSGSNAGSKTSEADGWLFSNIVEGEYEVDFVNKFDKWNVVLKKTDIGGELLAGAKFTLEKKNETAETDKWDYIINSEPNNNFYTTGDTGTITFSQLETGTYRISEEAAPEGYASLGAYIVFTLDKGIITLDPSCPSSVTIDSVNALTINVVNYQGYILPETGGGGLLIFTAIGFALLMTGALLLVNFGKKKKA